MPGFNQTGPSGFGPMTGRGRGLCKTGRPVDETGISGNADFGRGAGFGRGFRCGPGPEMRGHMGRGLGRNRAAFLEAYPEDAYVKIDMLKQQAESIKHTLDTISQRLSELEKSE
jgi:hypothetical protein